LTRIRNICIIYTNKYTNPFHLTSVAPFHNQAKHLFSQFTAKLGVEIWQIFTIITMILSFASTFLWFGLLNPNSLKNDLDYIDRSKALMYNAYQETFLEFSNIGGHTINSDFDACEFKFNQGYNNYEKQYQHIQKRQQDYTELEKTHQLDHKRFLLESGTETAKTTFNNLLTQFSRLNASSEAHNKLQIDLVNQITQACKDGKQSSYKDLSLTYLQSIENLGFSNQFNGTVKEFKESLYILNAENPMETVDTYGKILSLSPTFNDILLVVQPTENDFLITIQNLEKWQRNTSLQNTYLKLKLYYIYDQA
jgi:hypothetical protein